MAGAGFLVIGFICGHNKGFSDGFDYAVANSEEVSKKSRRRSDEVSDHADFQEGIRWAVHGS